MFRQCKVWQILLYGIAIAGCNGGGGGSSTETSGTNPPMTSVNADPYPFPPAKDYPTPPVWALPDFINGTSFGAKIAYGDASSEQVKNLNVLLNIANSNICSATPIKYDGSGTWLVTAAHCLVIKKTDKKTIGASELINPSRLSIETSFNNQWQASEATSVYVYSDYCKNNTFSEIGGCLNFYPGQDAGNGAEGNDIALIYTLGKIGNPENYAHLAPQSEFPEAYTMAPVLSIGSGITEDMNHAGVTFYVSNYLYRKTDTTGYHYLYSSYYDNNNGYMSLACGGDSGGGDLFWDGSKWILLATHSYGPQDGCGKAYNYLPNASTNVGYYYDWISTIINGSDKNLVCDNTNNKCISR